MRQLRFQRQEVIVFHLLSPEELDFNFDGEYLIEDSETGEEIALHAGGKGYPDLVRMRAGEPEGAPDAVLLPGDSEHVQHLLAACERSSLAVVPFGGGTSVVGGLAPLRGPHRGVVALDMQRMGRVLDLDRTSLTVTVEAGARAAALEAHLAQRGLTLGHFPQSFEYVSLGGCAATRSAGQASSGYGSIEKMVMGLRLCAPAGEIELSASPGSAAGPSMRQMLVGSEGVLGVITEISLRVRPAPRERCYEAVFFEEDRFEAALPWRCGPGLRGRAGRGSGQAPARACDRAAPRRVARRPLARRGLGALAL